MRKHYSNYFRGYRNIKPFRLRLVTSNSVEEVHQILEELASANLELSKT